MTQLPAIYRQLPRLRTTLRVSLMFLSLLGLAGCALPTFSTHASATATPARTPQPTPTTTLSPTQIQQQKAQAIATYMALFKNGIPGLLRDIPVAPSGVPGAANVQIGQTFLFPCSPVPFTERVIMPLYAYVTEENGQPIMSLTFGTVKNGKPTTFDSTTPYQQFNFVIGGSPLGGMFNGSACYGDQEAECTFLSNMTAGFCQPAAPAIMAKAFAKLITALGASMLKDVANPIIDPTSPGNKVAAYVRLPQDINPADPWSMYLYVPYTDVCSFEGRDIVCPQD